MRSPPVENRERALLVDILVESKTWGMLPEAEDIVRRAIAATSKVDFGHRNAELSVLL